MSAEPVDDNGFSIHRGGDWIARDLTAAEVMAFLTMGLGRDPGPTDLTVVRQYDGRTFPALGFIQKVPYGSAAVGVVEAWTAGTKRAAASRQDQVRDWWPALGQALDKLTKEINGAEG